MREEGLEPSGVEGHFLTEIGVNGKAKAMRRSDLST
jgi:hypothetical protein